MPPGKALSGLLAIALTAAARRVTPATASGDSMGSAPDPITSNKLAPEARASRTGCGTELGVQPSSASRPWSFSGSRAASISGASAAMISSVISRRASIRLLSGGIKAAWMAFARSWP